MADVPSLLMFVGRKHYRLHEAIDEYTNYGVSKRIPAHAIPDGMIKGLSKIFLAHPDAILKVCAPDKTLADLAYRLLEIGTLTEAQWKELVELDQPYWAGEELKPYDFVPASMLDIAVALSKVIDQTRDELIKEYDIKFVPGIFGYTFFTGFQVVMPKGVTELPESMEDVKRLVDLGYVEPVHVEYADDDGTAAVEEEEDTGA